MYDAILGGPRKEKEHSPPPTPPMGRGKRREKKEKETRHRKEGLLAKLGFSVYITWKRGGPKDVVPQIQDLQKGTCPNKGRVKIGTRKQRKTGKGPSAYTY